MPRPDTSLTERWLVPALCLGRPWLGPNLVKMYQSELFAAITEDVVLCAHFKLGSGPTGNPSEPEQISKEIPTDNAGLTPCIARRESVQ